MQAQPFLAAVAADPSLRGVLTAISNVLQGVKHGQAKLHEIEPTMTTLAETFEKALAGSPAFFSWQTSLPGRLQEHARLGGSCWFNR